MSKLLRILHLVHQYLPDHVGGTELYTHWLAQGLSQRGHQNIIFHRRTGEGTGLDNRTDETGTQIWAAWSGPLTPLRRFNATFGDKALCHAFERVLDQTQPHLVHVQHLMGLPKTLIDIIRRRDLSFVITLWDFWWVCANAQLLTNYSQTICPGPNVYLNCARCALARADRPNLWPAVPPLAALLAWRNHQLGQVLQTARQIIAPTPFVRDWYVEHGAPAETLTVIQPGLEVPLRPLRRSRSPEEPLRLAYIGGLSWQKGVHVLIEAVAGLEGIEVWLAGDETAHSTYVAQLRAQASPQVRFLGKLSRAEVWAILAQVDVVVIPTLWYETFSFIVSEAFAAGVPVIASRLGPLADRVRDGIDGLLVSPGDSPALRQAIRRLQEDAALLPQLQANVRPPHTLAAHVEEMEAIYQSVLAAEAD